MELNDFGTGVNGSLTISSNTTESPIDSSAVGTATSDSLTATNASFDAGQLVLIHQTRGSGAGSFELNFIESYVAGTITTEFPLVNTYNSTGANKAQVRVVPQYTDVNIQGGFTYTAKAWDGTVGGILAFLANGTVTVSGTIDASSKGFRYGSGGAAVTDGQQGEGTAGAGGSVGVNTANGNGGGAGDKGTQTVDGGPGGFEGGGGGGGGNASAGGTGTCTGGDAPFATSGTGGDSVGSSTMATINLGGGGGGGGGISQDGNNRGFQGPGGRGGTGGGIIMIYANYITVTGYIKTNGEAGTSPGGSSFGAAGGSGAGGSIWIRATVAAIGVNLLQANGGPTVASTNSSGGAGGNGYIYVQACEYTGSSNQGSVNISDSGNAWCQAFVHVSDN